MGNNGATQDDGPIFIPWIVNSADDWRRTFTVKIAGVAQDVTGWTWGGNITTGRNEATIVTPILWDVTQAASGIISYHVDYPNTKIDEGSYWYELDMKPTNSRRSFQAGKLKVLFSHSELT